MNVHVKKFKESNVRKQLKRKAKFYGQSQLKMFWVRRSFRWRYRKGRAFYSKLFSLKKLKKKCVYPERRRRASVPNAHFSKRKAILI